ncbi:MAG: PilZ domain-containing protein [Rhizobiaceae bacterium]
MTTENESNEHRVAFRQRVLKTAIAAFNEQFSAIPCVVRNVSETGAKLEFEDPSIVPREFILHMELDGYKVKCERVWLSAKLCGVRFIGEKLPTRVHRSQMVKPSEEALSERMMRDIEMRNRLAAAQSDEPSILRANRPSGPSKPTFGRRQ